jgi:hypothetical protein
MSAAQRGGVAGRLKLFSRGPGDSDSIELAALLDRAGPTRRIGYSARHDHSSDDDDDDGDGDGIHDDHGARRRPADLDTAYVEHEVLPHHTLAGIALQYRVTVRGLLSPLELPQENYLNPPAAPRWSSSSGPTSCTTNRACTH